MKKRFVVMVPHRDIRPAFREWQARLFGAGLFTVWSLPPVVPLAPLPLQKPLPEQERRTLARSLRALSRMGERAFFIAKGEPRFVRCPGFQAESPAPESSAVLENRLLLWGLPLEIPSGPVSWPPRQESAGTPATLPWISPLLLLAFSSGDSPAEKETARNIAGTLKAPEIRFRAAAVSNLLVWSLVPEEPDRENPDPENPGERSFDRFSFAWKLGKPAWLPGK